METECDKDSLYTDNSFQEFFLNLSQIYCTDFPDRQKLKGHCYKSITYCLVIKKVYVAAYYRLVYYDI